MRSPRAIIEIDEKKCTGCGECIVACAEGALALVDGKAKLIGEVYCDGLGACLGECPDGALTIVEREADEFDEAAVKELLSRSQPCGCPGSQARILQTEPAGEEDEDLPFRPRTRLRQWPVKLQLLGPAAPFLKGAHLTLLADCVAAAHPDLHRRLIQGHVIATGCPKLDDLKAHIQRLAQIVGGAKPASLTVAHMEVPCCSGFVHAALEAVRMADVEIPVKRVQIGITGEIQAEEALVEPAPTVQGRV
jgi:ferredoxin